MAGPARTSEVTLLLRRASDGDESAAADLLPLVYEELRARAVIHFRGQPAQHTLQPTALVHEAYVKLVQSCDEWEGRAHFCAVASKAMRQILIDHARHRAVAARDRDARAASATLMYTPSSHTTLDLLELDSALTRLGELNGRHANLVELRFFGGLSNTDVADVLEVSLATVERDWLQVRTWLARELAGTERE